MEVFKKTESMKTVSENTLKALAEKLRKSALKMALDCGNNGSHLGGGLSTIEIFAVLYGGIMNFDSSNPNDIKRDRLIVSKGHCVLAYYTALNEMKFLTNEDLKTFEVNGSGLHGHASRDTYRGIEFSGGSLGLGLAYAIGVALAGKLNSIPYHVYVILGDGECNEGIIWESLMSASHFKLDNLTIIIDNNKLQYDGANTEIMDLGNLRAKLESFGFYVHEVDGHSVGELYAALSDIVQKKPRAVIANTVKGKGVSFMENKKEWHHSRLTQEQFDIAISELQTLNKGE
jgi:transketolase